MGGIEAASTETPLRIRLWVRVTCVAGPPYAGKTRQRQVIRARYAQICA